MPSDEKLVHPISSEELERRWSAVRTAMDDQGVGALVMQNNNEFLGGYVKWFTDIPARNSYPHTIIFHREDKMTLVCQGPMDGDRSIKEATMGTRGIGRICTNPSYSSINYTKTYDATQAADDLRSRGYKTIGFVGPGAISYPFVEHLKENVSAEFIDASDLVDGIKAIKSPEEIERIKETALMQDQVIEAIAANIKPGMKDFEVAALAQYTGQINGSEQGIFLGTSAPQGKPSMFMQRHNQGRELQEGDHLALLVENNGPGGFYTEISRTFVLGKASNQLTDDCQATVEAQQNTLKMLKPGVPCKDIYEAHNEYMRSQGLPEERRLYSHGQGYDMVERPLIRDDETMTLEKDMNIVVHPGFGNDRVFAVVCDNYLITENGVSKCLHKTPQKIIEVY
ncbi:MAG: aminopeptidase P family protein [Rhodospirillaceae bacterium]|nr:aminopeptidase P family protein [Rhodospirillaceae bacterium]